jgi:hypothetical protein
MISCLLTYTHVHSHTLTYTLIHSHTLTYIHIHSHTLPYTQIHSHTLTYTHIYSHTLTYTHIHSRTLTYAHIHTHTLTYTLIHSHTLKHTHIHSNTLSYTHIHSHTLTYTHMHSRTLTHSSPLSHTLTSLTHSSPLSHTLTSLTHSSPLSHTLTSLTSQYWVIGDHTSSNWPVDSLCGLERLCTNMHLTMFNPLRHKDSPHAELKKGIKTVDSDTMNAMAVMEFFSHAKGIRLWFLEIPTTHWLQRDKGNAGKIDPNEYDEEEAYGKNVFSAGQQHAVVVDMRGASENHVVLDSRQLGPLPYSFNSLRLIQHFGEGGPYGINSIQGLQMGGPRKLPAAPESTDGVIPDQGPSSCSSSSSSSSSASA